jgi:hypothetical protein
VRRRTVLPALALVLVVLPAHSLEVGRLESGLGDGVYRVVFEAVLDAPVDAVAAVLTDYAGYRALDPRIRSSEVLGRARSGATLIRTRVHVCAAFFCRDVERVERVTSGDGSLVAEVVAGRSDFQRGLTQTRWRAARGRTSISYTAEFEPDFWVPVIVGHSYAVNELRESTLKLFENVEDRARRP